VRQSPGRKSRARVFYELPQAGIASDGGSVSWSFFV